MLKKIACWCLVLLFIIPVPVQASLIDDIKEFEQKYAAIYQDIDPALIIKMETFLQDVVDYVVVNYDDAKNIDIQIKNAIGSTLLTGDKYKYDLLPFMSEQSQNREMYQSQLLEMREIVRQEVQRRLTSIPSLINHVIIINKSNAQDVRQYSYQELNSSFASYKGDKALAGLYTDYYNNIKVGGEYRVYALYNDSSKLYADINATNQAFALIKGRNLDGTDIIRFNLLKYMSKTDTRFPNPVVAIMPPTVTRVVSNIDPTKLPTTEIISTPGY